MTGPSVTVAIPVVDEEAHIEQCLEAVASQTYPHVEEVLVVDGGSVDTTRERAAKFPMVTVLENPGRLQSAGLNVALDHAVGEVVVRVDARSVLAPDYVSRCVEALHRTGAAMVGGAIAPLADAGFAAAVAAAMRSPVGVGTARFHRPGSRAGWVDTVYLGAFLTEVVRSVGGYDDGLRTNEDAELAWRLQSCGGVWFDPAIRSAYRPRSTPWQLARQFFHYGQGRAANAQRHPRSLSFRQLAPVALLVGVASPWRNDVLRAYALVLLAGTIGAARSDWRRAGAVPLAMAEMHVAWAAGFLSSLPRDLLRSRPRRDGRR